MTKAWDYSGVCLSTKVKQIHTLGPPKSHGDPGLITRCLHKHLSLFYTNIKSLSIKYSQFIEGGWGGQTWSLYPVVINLILFSFLWFPDRTLSRLLWNIEVKWNIYCKMRYLFSVCYTRKALTSMSKVSNY